MTTPPLGRLTSVGLRDAWTSESAGFTPWLAEEDNLRLLGEAVGIELELEAAEQNVGPFRADILCKDTATGHWVLIENQLERSDHTHLGQLLTYASGLQAVTIVWIARKFTEEHRSVLDWLSDITDDRFNFFGLEIELWRIGNSAMAPKFNVVSKPNDWTRTVARGVSQVEAASLTPDRLLQQDFWVEFRNFLSERAPKFKPTKAVPHYFMGMALGRTGFQLGAVAAMYDNAAQTYDSQEIRGEVYLSGPHSKDYFAKLELMKSAIEGEIGGDLIWHSSPEAQACRIYVRKSANLRDREQWPAHHAWLMEKLDKLYEAFARRVRHLQPGVGEEDMGGAS